ncbi:MAG: amidohydrolase [Candidatus Bathyarchaeota archaeon]|nr:MAG: amidohydrolase [Candidatus Bathyarchaeota archaeon]
MKNIVDNADMVLLNGKVITVDAKNTITEAVAIKNNLILKVGTSKIIKKLVGERTHIVDVKGKTVLPGFIDSHVHAEKYSTSLKYCLQIHVPPLTSVEELLDLLKKKSSEALKGEWIIGRGSFHLDHKYREKRYPTKNELDKVAPDNPVALFSGMHIALVNSIALKMIGITKETPKEIKLAGRVALIEKDPATDEPIGIIREAGALIPFRFSKEESKTALWHVLKTDFVQQGITSIHDLAGPDEFKIFQDWMMNNELPLRIRIYFYMPSFGGDVDPLINYGFQRELGNEWLKFGGIKLMIDGGITGPKASLYQPYPHDVYDFGLLNFSQEELTELYVKAHQAGLQILSHTTGEKAQDMVMNAIEATIYEAPNRNHRHRLEHAGNYFATPERMKRMKELGAIPVVNPQFLHAFGFLMEHFYGKRVKNGLFPFKMLLNMGFKLPFSSDATGTQPEGTNPFWGIWCAIKRESFNGSILNSDQRISVMDAIRCYTIDSAYAGFEEKIKGSIESGKLADLIVISEDPLDIPVDRIKDIKVVMTIIDGRIVYKSKDLET